MVIVTVVYAVLYVYFMRFRIFEEVRLRNMVRNLDENRISGIDHFWGVNKVGNRGDDDGIIHYQRYGKTTRGMVIGFDRGSIVGVQEGNYKRFRETKMELLRELSYQKFDFQWYEIPKRNEAPEVLIDYFNIMTKMENQDFKKLLKLQIDINTLFATDAEQRYVDYIVIRNSNFKTLRRFKDVVQGIMDITLGTNSYIVDPKILNKGEVENFFADVLMVDSLDSNNIRKGVKPLPFERYASVQRLVQQDGRDYPIEFVDVFDLQDYSGGKSIEQLQRDGEKQGELVTANREQRKQQELDKLRKRRVRDLITDSEYREAQSEVAERFDKEERESNLPKGGEVEGIDETEKLKTIDLMDEYVTEMPDVQLNVGREVAERLRSKEEGEKEYYDENEGLSIEEMMRRDAEREQKN